MKCLFFEAFYGGSHKDFADGLGAHSTHRIDLVTLPARFWKWRMRGAAFQLFQQVPDPQGYDVFFTSSMTGLADIRALWRQQTPPCIVYFHENQFSYPLAPGEKRDYQYAFSNLSTALHADRVVFNSRYQRRAFLREARDFINRLPDYRPRWLVDAIEAKSSIIHPGCHFPSLPLDLQAPAMDPPLIIWNHRWEFDKGPELFFQALDAVARRGRRFTVALLGQRFETVPVAFRQGIERHRQRIVHIGFVPRKEDYYSWLRRATVVISTAVQENFGISVVEAVRMGCFPLLPQRLSYPELVPLAFHLECLYEDPSELIAKLDDLLVRPAAYRQKARVLGRHMARFAWDRMVSPYDELLRQTAAGENSSPQRC